MRLWVLVGALNCACVSAPGTTMGWHYPPTSEPTVPEARIAPPPQVETIVSPKVTTRPQGSSMRHHGSPLFLDWPLQSREITSFYGPRSDPIHGRDSFHQGIDLHTTYGSIIRAPANGTIVKAGWNNGHGRQLILMHDRGFETVYSHLSALLVSKSQYVQRGQAIGHVGNSGKSTGTHLHLEVLYRGNHRDPLNCFEIRLFDP